MRRRLATQRADIAPAVQLHGLPHTRAHFALSVRCSCFRPRPPQVEASSAYRGIGVVKLMGRQSGFIAMQASMASGVVDVVSGTTADRAGKRGATREAAGTQRADSLLPAVDASLLASLTAFAAPSSSQPACLPFACLHACLPTGVLFLMCVFRAHRAGATCLSGLAHPLPCWPSSPPRGSASSPRCRSSSRGRTACSLTSTKC